MNKFLYPIIIILIIVVGYQTIQLQELKKELLKKQKEPEVVIHIEKKEPTKQNIYQDKNSSIDEVIKSDFQKLFKDFFGNKEVKEGIKQSIVEFKKGLNQALSQLQQEFRQMDKESASVFNDLIKELNVGEFKTFEDKGDFYSYSIDIDAKRSKVNIDAKDGFLYIDITSKDEQRDKNKVIQKESKKSIVLSLPKDALLEKIKSEYKDKKLTITIPKIKSKVKI